MPAATLSHSRSARIPLASRHDVTNTGIDEDEWGPLSVPPSSQAAVPWDDQVVPALRRKLEQQSRDLSKRISRIEESDVGWARPRESTDRRDARASREIVHTHRESSIDQYHNRFATVRPARSRADVAASSFPFDSPAPRSSGSSDATQRARDKARQIAARQHAARLSQASTDSPQPGSIEPIPQVDRTSFERRRIRTHSTPMRPSIDTPPPVPSSPPALGHQRTTSLSRRKAAALDPKLIEEFGPLGSSSPNARRAQLDDASPMRRTQPDAFKSLSDASLTPDRIRGMREASAPPAFGRTDEFGALGAVGAGASPSRSVNWEDQIIPTVARKLQQQHLLAGNSTSTHEALIDTWDRNGLPLSQTDFAAQQRAARLEAEERHAQVHHEPTVKVEPERTESEVSEAPKMDRARSSNSQRSAQQRLTQQQEQVPLQEIAPPNRQQTYAAQPVHQVPAATAPPAKRTDTHGKSGCCCIVM
ncbi:uncharacterized protein PSANT_01659 [Moesziomyces antarcticus]|uniref:Uncharacterized protein n=2 Tax=Pseudozyma antarctica TaxID=84753 RepID=A0A5C3FI31_PSEA2|nr:uncharacterized protein PSANT_01659 [Moesziomyces antarcticus]